VTEPETSEELPTLAYPPRMTEFTQRFWDALGEGRFETTVCDDCGRVGFPPKFVCPACWSRSLSWTELSGLGVLRSFTEVLVAPTMFIAQAPYNLAVIDLDEGPRLLSRLVDPYDSLTLDARVRLVIRRALPVSLFEFTLMEGEVA
jgi:uncharacterized OB-fold protein